jgi:hypothetical protein
LYRGFYDNKVALPGEKSQVLPGLGIGVERKLEMHEYARREMAIEYIHMDKW